jgi:hypothetical protein
VDDRNERIKQHYWQLWGLDDDGAKAGQGMSSLKADEPFQGEEVTIQADDIEQFCKGKASSAVSFPSPLWFVQSWEISRKATKASLRTGRCPWTLPSSSAGSPS